MAASLAEDPMKTTLARLAGSLDARLGATSGELRGIGVRPALAARLPEPGAWTRMLAGLGAIGVAMRRRRARVGVRFVAPGALLCARRHPRRRAS